MKRNLFHKIVIAALPLFAISCSQPQLTLSLEGFSDERVAVSSIAISDLPSITDNNDPRIKVDTLTCEGGKIIFEESAKNTLYIISPVETPLITTDFYAIHGESTKLKFSRTENGYHLTAKGSALAEGMAAHQEHIADILNEAYAIYSKILEGDRSDIDRLSELASEQMKRSKEWLDQNMDNPAAVYLLSSGYIDTPDKAEYFTKMESQIKASPLAAVVAQQKREVEKYMAQQAQREKVKEGNEAPDFKLKNSSGKEIALSSLQGKWVILDFWGSWCSYCIKDFPAMKEFYSKNKSKVEIVGINCNDTFDRWRASVGLHELPWINLHNPDDTPSENNPAILYAVQGFPTKVVIDPKGVIRNYTEGMDEEFFQMVSQLIK